MPKRSTGKKTVKTAARGASRAAPSADAAKSYTHPEADAALRPDVGIQKQFKGKKPPKQYRYDSSLSPALEWDEQPAREHGEALIAGILDAKTLDDAKAKAEQLKAMSRPFLNWAGKAERQAFEVPTLPLFVHERLSTKAILETVKVHAKDKQIGLDLFGDPHRPIHEQLRAYEYRDNWVNRMILGDSLVVMNSLLEYEGLGGQVQMIYMDPPYGVDFGSNFQPFVRRRDVTHGDDADFSREPETVQAYRDTWELRLHSYLSYLRDRFALARDLLAPSGSFFLQISDENVSVARDVLDEVFGIGNRCALIAFQKTTGSTSSLVPTTHDFLLWYAKDRERVTFCPQYVRQVPGEHGAVEYRRVELQDGSIKPLGDFRAGGRIELPPGAKIFATDSIVSKGGDDPDIELRWNGKKFRLSCKPNRHWKVGVEGIKKLWDKDRLLRQEGLRIYKRYLEDFPYRELTHVWIDTRGEDDPVYVVQTSPKVIERCMLMTTKPGDLVLDPTCGSATTAYVAEQWGRRWITIDTSRVPLALARQRLITATFAWYELQDDARGPTGGLVYRRRQNASGEEVGGIVPHITLGSIANDEPPPEQVLVDRPEELKSITRVTGPFTLEATIPVPVDFDADGIEDSGAAEDHGDFVDRMVEVLRRSPDIRLPGNRAVRLEKVRRPAKSLSLSAEAQVDGKAVAVVFGPENGAVSEKLVFNAGSEARAKGFTHLFVIGFEIEPHARLLVEQAEASLGIPGTYVQATPDLVLGDLLKTMRSSQVFSVCGLPEIEVAKVKVPKGEPPRFQVTLKGLDTFDPATMDADHTSGEMVPAWFLDADYDATRCFRVCQAFFPKTGAWDNLRKALKTEYDESLWEHFAGTTSAPFEAGEQRQVAVKVIDERGNELLVVRMLEG